MKKLRATTPAGLAVALAVFIGAMITMSSGAIAADRHAIGIASGSLGSATIDGRPIAIGTPVFEGSQVSTGPTDSASLLLSSKVVVKVDSNTVCTIREAKGTHIDLAHGNVEVFLSKRGPVQGAVALSDPEANIEALGTVFIASYDPGTRDGYYATLESKHPSGISVKGSDDASPTDVPPGKQISLHAGKAQGGPVDLNQGDVKSHLGKTVDLDANQMKQAGAFSRQQTALAEFRQVVRAANGGRFAGAIATNLTSASQGHAIDNAVQWRTVTRLVESGAISATGGGGGGNSSGGLSDATVVLDTSLKLNFLIFDSGTVDGDIVRIRLTEGGKTLLTIPSITLAGPPGNTFSQSVRPGNVIITFTALNEGSLPPNTGALNILNTVASGPANQIYDLKTGQTATLKLKVKGP